MPYRSNAPPTTVPLWAAVANIVRDTSFLPAEASAGGLGTKHFAPATKVYVRRIFLGPGGEFTEVVARHRGSKSYVRMVVRSDCIENARARIVYSPRVRSLLSLESGSDETFSLERAESDVRFLNQLPRPYRP
ncbi:MAG: hypothetical protein HOO96_32620 [Polyangiaceae bacterium]|nr:hypothetical protein [Polyangiaceae bacterium]